MRREIALVVITGILLVGCPVIPQQPRQTETPNIAFAAPEHHNPAPERPKEAPQRREQYHDASRGYTPPQPQKLTVQVTAYNWTGRQTKMETWPDMGTIAVDPCVIHLGTRLYVPGYGWGRAEDTGAAIQGNIIDVYFPTEKEAVKWGRHKDIEILIYP